MDTELPRTLVLADDLTGALEMGVLARRSGYRAIVRMAGVARSGWPSEAQTVVLDTASRELPSETAAARVRDALKEVGGSAGEGEPAAWGVFKKTDSLLRGSIAAELSALADRFPERPLVYVPAYPLLGRLVRDGALWVLAEGAWQPQANIRQMLSTHFATQAIGSVADPDALERLLARGTHRTLLCDGETQADVDRCGEVLRRWIGRCIVAGPAGVFRALYGERGAVGVWPRLRCGVAYIGSTHPASIAQFDAVCTASGHSATLSEAVDFRRHASTWEAAQRAGQWLVLRCPDAHGAAPRMQFRPLPDALYLSGGATAAACLRLLACTQLEPVCELEPGVVFSEACLPDRRLPVITKSGAFGDARTLVRILAMLQEGSLPDKDA
ncbi:MAG: four-carbon acid sugar kinase family protein [Bryobacterales bacterium]|nr:four-carbon acid sugar kinase family protein [Bryobacterales bacterium]